MSKPVRDHSLDTLLDLDGQVFVVDPDGKYWVKFTVTKVDASPEKPHGLDYSLTLHGEKGQRLVGFDNAHPVKKNSSPGGRKHIIQDHRHRRGSVMPYEYASAVKLLTDFWAEVDAVLKKKGIIP
jgi:hypothetical protein